MKFFKFLVKSIIIAAFGNTLAFSAEHIEKVLVLGANQFTEKSWTESRDKTGKVWAQSLTEHGIELTTVCNKDLDPNVQYPDNLGTHITLNWDDDSQVQENLVKGHEGYFDLITNDYCVSYFIHDRTLPFFFKTLKIGGKFIYGPLAMHSFFPVSIKHPLTQDIIDSVENAGDISFYRYGIGTFCAHGPYSFAISMAQNDQRHKEAHLQHISEWLKDFDSNKSVAESKALMPGFIERSYERMKFENFIAFINEQCGFAVDIEIKKSNDNEIQDMFHTILPPDHPGAHTRVGTWLVMTRVS